MLKKVKRFIINPEAFLSIMANNTSWKVNEGVPHGSKIVSTVLDPHTGNLVIFIEHSSFDSVDVHKEVVPLLSTEFARIR